MSNVGVWDIKFHSIIFPDIRIYLSTEAYCFAITHTMVSHIHYNGYFEFCRVSSVFSSSFFHKKYAPPKVSNFWGAYQIYPPIFMSFIIFPPLPKSAQVFLCSHAFATQNASAFKHLFLAVKNAFDALARKLFQREYVAFIIVFLTKIMPNKCI